MPLKKCGIACNLFWRPHYRSTYTSASRGKRMAEIHRNLLDEGVIISRDGLGCLSTPMGQAEVDHFVSALEKALRG